MFVSPPYTPRPSRTHAPPTPHTGRPRADQGEKPSSRRRATRAPRRPKHPCVLPPPRARALTPSPDTQTLSAQLSYLSSPRPFKNPGYAKNVNRRAKNVKTMLGQERERERQERERRRLQREQAMDVDGEGGAGPPDPDALADEDLPSCTSSPVLVLVRRPHCVRLMCGLSDLSIEAPPSVLPQKHYCDITGLEARPVPPLLPV